MNKLRVLHVGAHENLIFGLYKSFNQKDLKISFDYILHKGGIDFKYKSDRKFDGILHYMPPINGGIFIWMLNLRKIVKKEKYKVIHFHIGFSAAFGLLALLNLPFVQLRICHAHSNYKSRNFFSLIARLFSKGIIFLLSDKNLACSSLAGKSLFLNRFQILNNAVPYKEFFFNYANRNHYREAFNYTYSEIIIGHVGNFYYPKNQIFLIKIFFELLKIKKNVKLLMIGDDLGSMNEVADEISYFNIESNVTILNSQKDTSGILSAIDFFIFPSIFEGIPLALIESQVNGIPGLFSDVIPMEVKISVNSHPFSLKCSPSEWARRAAELIDENSILDLENRIYNSQNISNNYNTELISHELESIYKLAI